LPQELQIVDQPEGASLRIIPGDQHIISRWVYALVAPFPTLDDGVSMEQLQRAWREGGGAPLYLDESTLSVFAARWGAPGPGAVTVLPPEGLLDQAWNSRPSRVILPFEALEPRWKVLEVDGLSPLRKGFDPAVYPLTLPVSLEGDPALVEALSSQHGLDSAAPLIAGTNRSPDRLTTLAMTGVTALVRATAFTMEQQGVRYPAQDIGGWLREADITHISNEVPFARDCPFPNPVQEGMRFCSDPRYMALLEDVGTDIVELTGDHFQDWGEGAMLFTLDLYRERGWPYYGGGANLEEARQAVTLEHNGNRLAFIGCNGKGGGFAQAGPHHPGAVKCDMDWMHAEITRLRGEGYLPIVTFQHFEYYTYKAQPDQVRDFRGMAQAGAVIVSGSQAHQPQGLEFESGALIHYGLGNLFFDQYDVSLACRQAFIDRHVFYDGRYISTELLPILFVDYARARPMTPDERAELLQSVFRASGW
jgi:poly-gamma-glutamate synthesis protein (capsule biosynthesis protein)